VTAEPWLLLTHQLPPARANARVTTWRRLRDIGALPARNAVYVLPNVERCRDDFERVRTEIVAVGGQATVFAGRPLDSDEHDRLIEMFRRRSTEEYLRLTRALARLRSSAVGGRRRVQPHSSRFRRSLAALRARTDHVRRTDFFQATGRADLDDALERLEAIVHGPVSGRDSVASGGRDMSQDFRARRWVTRPRPGVDRMASAWLIRRYIDPRASFAFVDRPGPGDVPFDMHEGEFTHQGPMCTFETLAHRFGLHDLAVARLARIVHDLDFKDDRFGLPETAAIGRVVDGLRLAHRDDATLLEQGIALFEALASVAR
jgi:hypothetical protein